MTMYYHGWDVETHELFDAIKRYKRACRKFIHGKPSPELAMVRLESAYGLLIAALSCKTIRGRLDEVIRAGLISGSQSTNDLAHNLSPEDLELETGLSCLFGLKTREVNEAIRLDDKDLTPVIEISSPEDLIERVEDFHDMLIKEAELAREIGTRIEKKRRKRNIGLGVTSLLFGSGCAVANTYAVPFMPLAAVSYGATATAFHAALRDLVGEKPKD